MKITRRMLLSSAAMAAAAAQERSTPPATLPATSPPDPLQRSAAAIARVPLPQLTEPAFSFKA